MEGTLNAEQPPTAQNAFQERVQLYSARRGRRFFGLFGHKRRIIAFC